MNGMTVLTFVRYYLPGYKSGGPIRSIVGMVESLSDQVNFLIVTSDRDAEDLHPYASVRVDEWNVVGKAKVFYASPRRQSLVSFSRLIRQTPHDILYLNSFFDPKFTLLPLLARALGLIPKSPTVIAPRGELSEGALSLKAWKKQPYLWVARATGLYNGLVWQASSELEAGDIRRVLGAVAQQIVVAPNIPPMNQVMNGVEEACSSRSSLGGPLRVVFLSRITPKKNLDFALRVLARVSVPIEFHIYGPIRDETYWRRCQTLINEMPAHVSVYYHGSVPHELVPDVIASHDLFFLPTRGENFGHVIFEALATGTPVLISDRTPWNDHGWGGCTVRALDDIEGFVAAIEDMARAAPGERARMRSAAVKAARSFLEKAGLRERNLNLFRYAYFRNRDTCRASML